MLPDYLAKAVPNPMGKRVPWYANTAPTYAGIFLWIAFYQQMSGGTLQHAGLGVCLAALAVAPAHCLLCHHPEREVDPRVGACADVDRQHAPAYHQARSYAQAERQGGPASPHRWRPCSRSRSGRSRRRRREGDSAGRGSCGGYRGRKRTDAISAERDHLWGTDR